MFDNQLVVIVEWAVGVELSVNHKTLLLKFRFDGFKDLDVEPTNVDLLRVSVGRKRLTKVVFKGLHASQMCNVRGRHIGIELCFSLFGCLLNRINNRRAHRFALSTFVD